MSSHYGENIQLTIFGQSHSPAIGVTIDGLPSGIPLDLEALQQFMNRRAPGHNEWSTPRSEADRPEFLCGLHDGITCGAPLTAVIHNHNTRSGDYDSLADCPRPGHADLTAYLKYGPHRDYAGGGHFSGRLTAPLCIAGGICLQLLAREGITVMARIRSIADAQDDTPFLCSVADKEFPASDDAAGARMRQRIAEAKADGDSVGGIVECLVLGLPAGLGDPMFGGMENRMAAAIFAIPAVKGVEFGDGFEATRLRGSENNDSFAVENHRTITTTNHCGGILGGITDGMPLVVRAAFKPTPSIAKPQQSVSLTEGKETTLQVHGRHDPCIVPRAVPCVEAAAAIAVYDAWLSQQKYKEVPHGVE